MNNIPMGDKELMHDGLSSQKLMTSSYNNFANECATPNVRSDFMKILNEEHQIQAEIFTEMSKRGWYETKPADMQQITTARQKYQSMQ